MGRRVGTRAGSRRVRAATALTATVVALAACSVQPTTQTLVADDAAIQLELPVGWNVYGDGDLEDSMAADSGMDAEDLALARRLTTTYAFDGAPTRSLEQLFRPTSDHPWGYARRVQLPPTTPYSRAELRSIVVGFDPLGSERPEQVDLRVLEQQTIEHGDGVFGERLVFEVDFDGERIATDQTIVRDLTEGSVYQLILACTAACYQAHRSVIDDIVSSWALVEDR